MHCDIHLVLHDLRAAELHATAAVFRPARPGLRHRMGWTMIELGLRLTQASPAPARTVRAV
ncbi:hypothetical protein ACFYY2_19955 [Streptomyces sp. NPDC001822]|uniref:hypothetical protein n=1 Tax=Streptomyces sp. NPDC001822 TaxID=3364614 RepID=UPI00368494AD